MKEEFRSYLNSLGMSKTSTLKIEEFYHYYESLCPEHLSGIFVTDYIESSDTRVFENLWFFSENYVMEVKNFLGINASFDLTLLKKKVLYWEMRKKDYDFSEATNNSRLTLAIKLRGDLECVFKAAKSNCDVLKTIFLKYIKNNLEPPN